MLWHTKGTTIDGEPIITLPPKIVTLQKVEFSTKEHHFYHLLEAHLQAQFKVYAAAGIVKKNYVNILLMLLHLRKTCDNSLLVKVSYTFMLGDILQRKQGCYLGKKIDLINYLEGSLSLCGLCNNSLEEAVVTICSHIFCNQFILDCLTQSYDSIFPNQGYKRHLKDDSMFSV